jgi:hypothetical protein
MEVICPKCEQELKIGDSFVMNHNSFKIISCIHWPLIQQNKDNDQS